MNTARRLRWQLKSLADYVTKLPTLRADVRRLDATQDLDDLVPLLCRKLGKAHVVADQVVYEIRTFADELRRDPPRTVVEIGTSKGGTLYLWSRLCAEGATLCSIDLPGQMGSVRPANRGVYRTFGRARGVTTHTMDADSQQPATRDAVQALLGGRPIDFLFIDGDHSFEGVQRDFELYAPLVRPGGVIALHDVAIGAPDPWIRCKEFWVTVQAGAYRELLGDYTCTTIVADPAQGEIRGIGVLRRAAES